uniref:Uncharacterized protein n=1 Tax=Rhizophora mucronata TaxID=61149 RepID=A0A2P2LAX2_RHIMU
MDAESQIKLGRNIEDKLADQPSGSIHFQQSSSSVLLYLWLALFCLTENVKVFAIISKSLPKQKTTMLLKRKWAKL